MSGSKKLLLAGMLVAAIGCERQDRNEIDELVAEVTARQQREADARLAEGVPRATRTDPTGSETTQPSVTEPAPADRVTIGPNQQPVPGPAEETDQMHAQDAQALDQDSADSTTAGNVDRNRVRNGTRATLPPPAPTGDQQSTDDQESTRPEQTSRLDER